MKMHVSILQIGGCVVIGLTLAVVPAATAQSNASQPAPMPSDRAKSTFDDVRVKTFMSIVNSEVIGAKCSLPEPAKTLAREITLPLPKPAPGQPPIPPDFRSFFYEIEIPCSGKDGLRSLLIRPEFAPPMGNPQGMTLSLRYRGQ